MRFIGFPLLVRKSCFKCLFAVFTQFPFFLCPIYFIKKVYCTLYRQRTATPFPPRQPWLTSLTGRQDACFTLGSTFMTLRHLPLLAHSVMHLHRSMLHEIAFFPPSFSLLFQEINLQRILEQHCRFIPSPNRSRSINGYFFNNNNTQICLKKSLRQNKKYM
jgi:hypothetical protein